MREGMMARRSRAAMWRAGASAIVLAALSPVVAEAQAQPAGGGSGAGGGHVGVGATTETTRADNGVAVSELVVTATKRDVQLREVPATVNVVTGAQLAARGPITGTGDILQTVPGVRFNDLSQPSLSEISIRGSGTERATGAASPVGLFRNGIYIGGGNFDQIDHFDLDHVEVLSGPQGALYGRNAEFGVVNLISAKPSFSDSGFADDAYTFETRKNQLQVVMNHPLSDDLAVRLGFEDIDQSGGFVFNPDANKYYDATNGWIARGQLRYSHGPLDLDLLAEAQQMSNPVQWSGYDVSPLNPIATLPLGFSQQPYVIPHGGIDSNSVGVDRLQLFANYDFGWAKLSSSTNFERDTRSTYNGTNIDLATAAMLEQQDLDAVKAGLLTVAKAKSLYPLGQTITGGVGDSFYEDLHLSGDALQGRLGWLAGFDALYSTDNAHGAAQANPCATPANNNPADGTGGAPKGAFPGICGGTPSAPVCYELLPNSSPCPNPYPLVPGQPFANWGSNSHTTSKYVSVAPYASLSVKLGWGFTLAGDVRYTRDDKSAFQTVNELYFNTPYVFLAGGAIAPRSYRFDHANVSYTATLSYKLPGPWDDLVYAKFGTGYRGGGFNFNNSPLPGPGGLFTADHLPPPAGYAPVIPTYGNESSESYEIGFKGTITRHLYLTIDAYMSQTYNALEAVVDGCAVNNSCETGNSSYTVNAGIEHGGGIEVALDTSFELAGGHLDLDFTGSDQTAKSFAEPGSFAGLPTVGTPVPQNPRWLASVSADYRRVIFGQLRGFANVTYHGQWGGVQDALILPSFPAIPLATIQDVDLRAGIDYRRLELAFVARNLTNEIYKLAQFGQAASAAFPNQVTYTTDRWSLPRTMSLELTYKW